MICVNPTVHAFSRCVTNGEGKEIIGARLSTTRHFPENAPRYGDYSLARLASMLEELPLFRRGARFRGALVDDERR